MDTVNSDNHQTSLNFAQSISNDPTKLKQKKHKSKSKIPDQGQSSRAKNDIRERKERQDSHWNWEAQKNMLEDTRHRLGSDPLTSSGGNLGTPNLRLSTDSIISVGSQGQIGPRDGLLNDDKIGGSDQVWEFGSQNDDSLGAFPLDQHERGVDSNSLNSVESQALSSRKQRSSSSKSLGSINDSISSDPDFINWIDSWGNQGVGLETSRRAGQPAPDIGVGHLSSPGTQSSSYLSSEADDESTLAAKILVKNCILRGDPEITAAVRNSEQDGGLALAAILQSLSFNDGPRSSMRPHFAVRNRQNNAGAINSSSMSSGDEAYSFFGNSPPPPPQRSPTNSSTSIMTANAGESHQSNLQRYIDMRHALRASARSDAAGIGVSVPQSVTQPYHKRQQQQQKQPPRPPPQQQQKEGEGKEQQKQPQQHQQQKPPPQEQIKKGLSSPPPPPQQQRQEQQPQPQHQKAPLLPQKQQHLQQQGRQRQRGSRQTPLQHHSIGQSFDNLGFGMSREAVASAVSLLFNHQPPPPSRPPPPLHNFSDQRFEHAETTRATTVHSTNMAVSGLHENRFHAPQRFGLHDDIKSLGERDNGHYLSNGLMSGAKRERPVSLENATAFMAQKSGKASPLSMRNPGQETNAQNRTERAADGVQDTKHRLQKSSRVVMAAAASTAARHSINTQRAGLPKSKKGGGSTEGRAKPRHWTAEEDEQLKLAVTKYGEMSWKLIAKQVPSRNHVQCLQRWKKALDPRLVKGPWSEEEDQLLARLVHEHGLHAWKAVAKAITGRNTKQCRERWRNYLDPNLKRGKWTAEEDAIIMSMQKKVGNKWAAITKKLPGRTDNQVKIRFNSLYRKEAAKQSAEAYLSALAKK